MATNENPLIRVELGNDMFMTGRKTDVLKSLRAYQQTLFETIHKIGNKNVKVFVKEPPHFTLIEEPKTPYKPRPPSVPKNTTNRKPVPIDEPVAVKGNEQTFASGLVVTQPRNALPPLSTTPPKPQSPPKIQPGVQYAATNGTLEKRGKQIRSAWMPTNTTSLYPQNIGNKETMGSADKLTLESVESPTKGGKKTQEISIRKKK